MLCPSAALAEKRPNNVSAAFWFVFNTTGFLPISGNFIEVLELGKRIYVNPLLLIMTRFCAILMVRYGKPNVHPEVTGVLE